MGLSWHDDRHDDLLASRRRRDLVTTHRGRAVACPITDDGHILGPIQDVGPGPSVALRIVQGAGWGMAFGAVLGLLTWL